MKIFHKKVAALAGWRAHTAGALRDEFRAEVS